VERQFIIRSAVLGDAPALAVFAARQFIATYSANTPEDDLQAYSAKSFSAEQQASEITDPDSHVLLATAPYATTGETIIGYAHVHITTGEPPSAFLNRIYVDQAWKGKAVGSALLAHIMTKARECGAQKIALTVYEKNTAAVAFYRKTGFSVVGTDIFIVGRDTQRDLVMEKLLT
jgi:diamine N-acetyltransferase